MSAHGVLGACLLCLLTGSKRHVSCVCSLGPRGMSLVSAHWVQGACLLCLLTGSKGHVSCVCSLGPRGMSLVSAHSSTGGYISMVTLATNQDLTGLASSTSMRNTFLSSRHSSQTEGGYLATTTGLRYHGLLCMGATF